MEELKELLKDKYENLPFSSTVNEHVVLQHISRASQTDKIDFAYKNYVAEWITFNKWSNQFETGEYVSWVSAIYSQIQNVIHNYDDKHPDR